MKESTPVVSAVLTTYKDDPRALERAVGSILAQTLKELECIVVFESGDSNCEALKAAFDDPRLIIVRRPPPRNRNACHNHGLALARGRYVARMDGDDYSHPERLEREVAFLRAHPDVAMVGSAGRLFDDRGNVVGIRRFPSSHTAIMRSFVLTNPILHPSVVWDRERIGGEIRYYDKGFFAEDLELWFQMLARGARFANLPEALVDYEIPEAYTRPMGNWSANFRVRRKHWRLCLRYPSLALGIACFGIMTVLPRRVVDALTARGWLSDRLRSIRSYPGGRTA